MSKFAFVKTVVAAGGLLFLCAAPELALGQSSQPSAAALGPMKPASAPRAKSAPPDLLEGLTLTDDQKSKIEQIREDTKSRQAAVARDKNLDAETADAFLRGYQRNENAKILEVLTPAQQKEVRKRIATWRATTGKPQYPSRPAPVGGQTPQPQ